MLPLRRGRRGGAVPARSRAAWNRPNSSSLPRFPPNGVELFKGEIARLYKVEDESGGRASEDMLDEMLEDAGACLFWIHGSAINVHAPFLAMGEVILSFEDADDGHHAVVVPIAGEVRLDLPGRGFAEFPDDPHDFEFFVGECL